MGAITLIGRESETGITIHPPGGAPVKSSGGMLYDMITLRAMTDAAARDSRLVGTGDDRRARLDRIRERYDADYPTNFTPAPFRDPEFWRAPGAFIGDMECQAYEGQNDDYYVVNSIFMPKGTHIGIFDAPKAKHAADKPHVFIRVERPGIVLQVVLHEEGDTNHSVDLVGGESRREPAREGHDFVHVGPQKPGRVGGKVSRVLIYGHAFTSADEPAVGATETLRTMERHLLASTSFRERQPPMAMGFEQRWACTWRNSNGNNYRWYRPSWAAVGPDLITAVTRFDHIKGVDRDDHAVVAYLFDTSGKHIATHTALHPASGVAGDINQATAVVGDVAAGVGGASALIPGGVGQAVGAVATATQVASAIIGTTAELVANAAKTGGFVALLDEARLKGMRVLDAAARTRDKVKVGWEDRAANVVAACFVEMLRALFLDYPKKSGRAFEFRAAEANTALSEYAGAELVKFVENDGEHNYRIYAPAWEVADGEVHMIAKIDHIRGGGNNDDHASIRWTFSPRTLNVIHWSCSIDYGETLIGSAIASYTINIASGALGLKGGIPAFKGKFSGSLSSMRTIDVARGFRSVGRVVGKRNAIKMYADGVAPSVGNAIVSEAANRYVAHKYSEFRDLPGSKRPHFSVAIEAIQRQITHAGALVTAALGLAEQQEAERVAAAEQRRKAHIQVMRESLVNTVSLASINAYNVLWEYNRKDRIRRAREASERAREHERLYRPEYVAQVELDERWSESIARAQRLSGRAPVNGASALEFCQAFQWLQAEGYGYYPVDGARRSAAVDASAAARKRDRDAWHDRLKRPASRRGGERCFVFEGQRAHEVFGAKIGARIAKTDEKYFVYEPRIELADGAMFLEYRVERAGGEARLRLIVDRTLRLLRVHAPRIELGGSASRLGRLLGSWVGEHVIDYARAAARSTDSDALEAFVAQALRDTVGRRLDHPPQPLHMHDARLLTVLEAVLADACFDVCQLSRGSFANEAQRQRVVALGAMAWPGHALRLTSGQAKLEPSVTDGEWRASLLQLRPGLADPDDPSLVSLRQEARYLRHVDGRIERALDDGSAELRASATFRWRPSVSERGARFISLEALERPGHFILHRNFSYWLDRPKDQVERECATIVVRDDAPPERRTPDAPAPFDVERRPLRLSLRVLGIRDRFVGAVGDTVALAPCAHDRDRGAFSFEVVPGLSDRQKVSLRSVAFPGRYLCHERGRVVLREHKPGAGTERATFSWVAGHSETGERFFSLETLGQPPERVTHRDGGFVIEKRATGVFGIASTFVIERPLLPARALARGELVTLGGLNRPAQVLTPRVGDYGTPEDVKPTGLDDGVLGLVRDAASFRVVGGLADPEEVSLESLEFPNHFLRHKNRVVLLELDDGSDQHHADATFRARPGLAEQGPRFVSLEAVNLPNNYLTCGSGFALSELRTVEERVAATLVVGRPEPGRLHIPRAPAAFSAESAWPGQRVSLQVFGRRAQHLFAAPDQPARLGPVHGAPEPATFRVMPGLADPRKVSFESVAHPGHYLAHFNFVLRLRKLENTPLFRGDATFEFTDDVGERCECYTALRSHNCDDKYLQYAEGEFRVAAPREGAAGMNAVFVPVPPLSLPPRVFIRAGAGPKARYVRGGRGRAKLVTAVTDEDRRAAAFSLVPGLCDPAKVSFESVLNPGRFLRHRSFKLFCEAYEGTELFREDATFARVPGLATRGAKLASFTSANFDKRVLQRRGELLVLESAIDDEAKAAATFVVEEATGL